MKNGKVIIYTTFVLFTGFVIWYASLIASLQRKINLMEKEISNMSVVSKTTDVRVEKLEGNITTLTKEDYVEKDTTMSIAKSISPSVVFILAQSSGTGYNSGGRVLMTGAFSIYGTGFFISSDGYIATAAHVVSDLTKNDIEVEDFEGNHYEVERIATDKEADVAVLKIKTSKRHPAVTSGHFGNIEIGEEVGIIGFNPGFNIPLLHTGSISSKGFDETGAQIFTVNSFANKGNSGSPVFSLTTGRVLGILSARKSETQTHKFLDPNQFSSTVSFGGVGDPIKLSVGLYNETVKIVEEVSQVGIGIAYSIEKAGELMNASR